MRIFTFLTVLAISTSSSIAQWSVVNLHPQGYRASNAYAVEGSGQYGTVLEGNQNHPAAWNGESNTFTDFSPTPDSGGYIFAVSNGIQVGELGSASSWTHAALWRGTAESWVELGPTGNYESSARATSGNQQVGYLSWTGLYDPAILWHGTRESMIDLHPSGAFESRALACADDYQAGFYRVGEGWENERACLWRGTPESIIDLNPSGITLSQIVGAHGDQQVGFTNVGAGLWRGTAASFVRLSPASSTWSFARAVYGGYQVGEASFDGVTHGGIWHGTSDSWVDLHPYLPSHFSSSDAKSLWIDSGHIYVVGSGFNTLTNRGEAIMWVRPVPEPTTIAVLGIGLLAAIKKRRRSPDSRSIK